MTNLTFYDIITGCFLLWMLVIGVLMLWLI